MFSSIWGISLLGAIGEADNITLPFDPQYKDYVNRHLAIIKELLSHIQRTTSIAADVIELGLDDSPWARLGERVDYYTADVLDGELVLMSGEKRWVERSYEHSHALRPHLRHCTVVQMTSLFDALLAARFAFVESRIVSERLAPFLDDCETILRLANLIAGPNSPYRSSSPLLTTISASWQSARALGVMKPGGADPSYQLWLTKVVREIGTSNK